MLWTKIGSIALLLLVAVGCETSERPRTSPPPYDSTEARPEASDDFESLAGYTYEQRSDFQTKVESALNKLDRKVDEWKMKSRNVAADARESWDAAVAELRVKRETLRQSFARTREATAENWDEMKGSFRRAWEDLEDSFEKASAKFH